MEARDNSTARNDRRRLDRLWRTLDELNAGAPRTVVGEEFAGGAMVAPGGVARREFLKVAAASVVAAGVGAEGCSRGVPTEIVVPQVNRHDVLAESAQSFATAFVDRGYAIGVAVTSWNGHPTKVEGNPDHPASLGATDVRAQAAVMGLYDPDRSRALRWKGRISTWTRFERALADKRAEWRSTRGGGLRVLTGAVTSPTVLSQIRAVLKEYPEAKWHRAEAIDDSSPRGGARAAFGRELDAVFKVDAADVIVAFDSDFLAEGPGRVRHAWDFGTRRQGGTSRLNRMYTAEPCPTITGTNADERLRARRSEIPALVGRLATLLGVRGVDQQQLSERYEGFVRKAAADLARTGGASLVVAGPAQVSGVHVLVWAINAILGNVGKTVEFIEPVEPMGADGPRSLAELVDDLHAGRVSSLIVLDANPAYWADPSMKLDEALASVGFTLHLGLYWDETGRRCLWHVPMAHDLESWGDARAFNGTATILQPLIKPLYGGRSAHEILHLLHHDLSPGPQELVRETWRSLRGDDLSWWRGALRKGVVPESASRPVGATFAEHSVAAATSELRAETARGYEVAFAPDPFIADGRYANNAWLQELPRPETTLTWRNAVMISPATAAQLKLELGDEVEVEANGRRVSAPVYLMPGHADDAVTLTLGYGRGIGAGALAVDRGYNAYPLRGGNLAWKVTGAGLKPTGRTFELAVSQHHHKTEGREILRVGLEGAGKGREVHLSLFPPIEQHGPQWGMSIDLTACIGCSACVIACQAENNIPCVGEREVIRMREMHWIRVDRYHRGSEEEPEFYHQPVPCMHCEKAPCELVCPVGATQHSGDGLNEMIYNRCVGTRYCSNNCPYKVRRFNFFRFSDWDSPSVALQYNPKVTVRARGVMEKCTYCVQRIRAAEIVARREARPIRDGEIVPACAQVCPTRAIVFGDITDPESRVSRAKGRFGDFSMLGELNTRPRTTYYPVVRNPFPVEPVA